MALRIARDALSRIFFQRCFYLFLMLLVLIVMAPFLPGTPSGRFGTNLINAFVVVATVAAVGRSLFSFALVLLLALPTLGFQWLGISESEPYWLVRSWAAGALLYAATLTYLLQYVFRREVMTADKLFGAAAGYLMLAILWAYLYAIIEYAYPKSFLVGGQPSGLDFYDGLYFSMTVLTSTGFGDITPLSRAARSVCMVEQVAGALFVAILIARLAGVYPQGRVREEDGE
ncbi:MAG: potassium channel family protein [Burkholderiales bacterium]